jgi:multidrug efflux pump subunit AcrA (membrane-fusion protein)
LITKDSLIVEKLKFLDLKIEDIFEDSAIFRSPISGRISKIYLKSGDKFSDNDGEFFENNYEIGKILKPVKGIIIPKDAVIRTGNKDIVYLYENGNFKKFEIEIITDVKDGYLVKNLKEGQIIVNKGVFLIDADAKLK